MAFDPTKPVEESDLDAAQIRDQLNGLKALIDAMQAQLDLTSGDLGALQTTVNDYIANHP